MVQKRRKHLGPILGQTKSVGRQRVVWAPPWGLHPERLGGGTTRGWEAATWGFSQPQRVPTQGEGQDHTHLVSGYCIKLQRQSWREQDLGG